MTYLVNRHELPVASVSEIQPASVQLSTFSLAELQAGLFLVSALRYNMNDEAADPKSLATLASVTVTESGGTTIAIVSLSSLWLPASDPPAAGDYRVEILVRNSSTTRIEETNLIFHIVG